MWKVSVVGLLFWFSVLPLFGMKKFLSKSSDSDDKGSIIQKVLQKGKSKSESEPSDMLSESGGEAIVRVILSSEKREFHKRCKDIQKQAKKLQKEFK